MRLLQNKPILLSFQTVEHSAPKSPSPSREVPSTTTLETPGGQEEQPQQQQTPTPTAARSPEDNRVSSTAEHPSLQNFVGMFRFGILFFFLLVPKEETFLSIFTLEKEDEGKVTTARK